MTEENAMAAKKENVVGRQKKPAVSSETAMSRDGGGDGFGAIVNFDVIPVPGNYGKSCIS